MIPNGRYAKELNAISLREQISNHSKWRSSKAWVSSITVKDSAEYVEF